MVRHQRTIPVTLSDLHPLVVQEDQIGLERSAGGTDASVANNIPGGGGGDDSASKFAIVEKSDQTTTC